MPEGPEVRRARDKLASVLEGREVEDIEFTLPELHACRQQLLGQKIISVESRGKAMLIHFSNNYAIYSHNQLYGRWYVEKDKSRPDTTRQLRIAIYTVAGAAFLFSASDINVLTSEQLSNHPYLDKLGIELLADETTEEMVFHQLNNNRASRRCLMSLLQDQTILSGMGNYLCCEVLYLSALHPETRMCDLDDSQLQLLAHNSLILIRQSYAAGGITHSLKQAMSMKQRGIDFEDYRFYVYRRAGLNCYRCGGEIVKGKFCGRMGYCCPNCQV